MLIRKATAQSARGWNVDCCTDFVTEVVADTKFAKWPVLTVYIKKTSK